MNRMKWAATAIIVAIVLCTGPAQGVEIDWPEPNWLEIFEPNQLRTFYLTMDPCDWQAILHNGPGPDPPDCILVEIEKPAMFWMDGEDHLKISVAVRRKKGFAFPDEVNPEKVALKIDINQYYCDPCEEDCGLDPLYDPNAAPDWHGLKKLSLEVNIDSIDVISEGVACNIHQMASVMEGHVGFYANWVKLYVNGNYIGIYANVEQRDKQFLRNRDLYVSHDSWLYKYADCVPDFVLKVGDDDFPKSPAVEVLSYDPFVHASDANLQPTAGVTVVPGDRTVVLQLSELINMQGMLATAAVDAFLANSDPLFESENNTYFHDFNLADPCETRKRMYFPWDVDASFKNFNRDIYYTGQTYDAVIMQKQVFRSQYNQIMTDLLTGPLTFADINDFLDMVEPVISAAVEADPLAMDHIFNRIGATSAAEVFDWLRSWFAQRIPNVFSQVDMDAPLPPLLPPGIILLEDGFEGEPWDANWNDISHNWTKNTWAYGSGAWAKWHKTDPNMGIFTCDALDASDATAIHIDFWVMKDRTDVADDFLLYYFDGTNYDPSADLHLLGGNDEWLHYTDTITDSQYFVPNFRIKIDATLDRNELVWVDDVVITKETLCTKANLDCVDPVNFDDFVILGNDWELTGAGLAGDIDGNDVVNFGDLDWLVNYWLSDCGQP